MAVWPYIPQRRPTESLEWMTDVIRCSAKEYRHCLRKEPRQEWSYTFQMTPAQFGRAKGLARSIGGSTLDLPIWTEQTVVGAIAAHTVNLTVDTAGASYEDGGELLVWESDTHYEVVTIATVGVGTVTLNPWVVDDYTDALVMPLREATFAQPFEADRDAVAARVVTQARFLIVETQDLSSINPMYDTYKDSYLVTDPPLEASNVREEYEREVETLDSGSGLMWRGSLYAAPIRGSVLGWGSLTRTELVNVREWLHTVKGRWKSIWVPSWNADVTVTADVVNNSYTVEIADIDFNSFFTAPCDFAIITTDGLFHCIHVLSCADGDPGKEVLTVEDPNASIPLNTIARTSLLTRARFAADRVEIQHEVGGYAACAVPTVEVPG